MITVKNLTKIYRTHEKNSNFIKDLFFRKFKESKALDNISFDIGENELVGFIGPNGAGKTTTMKILSGILYPTSGAVTIMGEAPFEKKPAFLKSISFIMGQRNQLIWDIPALDTFQLNKEIYEIGDTQFSQTIEELGELLKCKHLFNRPVKTLSLGERMKMELIAGLLHRPKIVFFDEPTIGLDIFSQETIRDFIRDFQKKYNATIMLTSHYMEDVKKLCTRLIIINKGLILYDGKLSTIVEKYSKFKIVKLTLDRQIDQTTITEVGTPLLNQFPQLVYKINRAKLPETINLINKKIPYSDLTVEEEEIEDIIKHFFKENT